MLSKNQLKTIKLLHTKKGRAKAGLCLVEGSKVIEAAGDAVEYTFGPEDVPEGDSYRSIVDAQSPQPVSGVARLPEFAIDEVTSRDIVVVLDGVQDPGNVGSILRLCLGFDAGLVLVDSVDVTNPKVVRASVGAIFEVPWANVARDEAVEMIEGLGRTVYRLEKSSDAASITEAQGTMPIVLVVGSEGSGIKLDIAGKSLSIEHSERLESLNVGHALAIVLEGLRN